MSDLSCFDALKTQLIRALFFTNAALKACDLDKFLISIGRNPSYVDLEVSQFEANFKKFFNYFIVRHHMPALSLCRPILQWGKINPLI